MISKIKTVITGIQPTNKITLGNYFGAIKPLIALQNTYKIYAFVADLHSITTTFDHNSFYENKKNVVLTYLASGINPEKTKIFIQSDVHAHAELGHVLCCHTTIGELKRMTQFKDKSAKSSANGTEFIPTGLLIYPTLMAADILLYDCDYVATGSDQKQHIELTRNIANRFNNKYGKTFKVPEPMIPKSGARIMDLIDPSIKMSKSNKNEKGTIFLLDPIQTSIKKIMSAKTDGLNSIKFDIKNQPGVSNLLTIYSCLTNESIDSLTKRYAGVNYGQFKKDLAEVLSKFLKDFQDKYSCFKKEYSSVEKMLKNNANVFNKLADSKLSEVYKKIGMR